MTGFCGSFDRKMAHQRVRDLSKTYIAKFTDKLCATKCLSVYMFLMTLHLLLTDGA